MRSRPKPSVPMLLFVSNGKMTGDDEKTWRSFPKTYAEGMDNIRIIEVDAGHNLYNIETARIELTIRDFLS